MKRSQACVEYTQPMYNGSPCSNFIPEVQKTPESSVHQRHRNLKYVNIVGREPFKPQQIPQCLVLCARSIVKPDTFSALYADIKTNNIDICCISETWLNHTVCNSQVCPSGYTILRKDRTNRRGGGVAIPCRNDWKMEPLPNLTNSFECL